MRCDGKCATRKKPLGIAVYLVDKKPLCVTCFEVWMTSPGIFCDNYTITRLSAKEADFDIRKGPTGARVKVIVACID